MVRHKFYYDPLWLIVLGPVLGIFRYIWASQSLLMFAPVCSRHGWRLSLPTWLGYFFAFSLLLLVPVLIASSQIAALGAAMGWIWLAVFLYVLGMLALLLVARLATPRLVDFDTGSVTFGSVSLGFKAAITGQALPGQGLRSVGHAEGVFPAQVVPVAGVVVPGAAQPAYGTPLRSPGTSNGPLIALVAIGGGALVLLLVGSVVVGASYLNRARHNAEARRRETDAKASMAKSRAEAEARHAQHIAELAANARRTASTPRTTSPSSTFPTSTSPAPPTHARSTTLPKPILTPPAAPTPAAAPVATTTTQSTPPSEPPPSEPAPSTPDDPFGVGQQIGPPSTVSVGGIAPKPRPDLEAKAANEPIRGRFDKPDAGGLPGPDGQVEVVFESRFRGAFPPNSRPLARVTELRVGMEIWVQGTFDDWRRGNVVGVDGLRAMVHIYGWDHDTDELVAIPRIRVATNVEQPKERPAAGTNPFADKPAAAAANPFEDPVPAKKRTWTDSTGKFKIEAEFVKLAAGNVTLKRNDGSEISLPLDLLAAPDQAIAKKLAE
jgi:hypothetical protein